jgi:hypothetical protein
MACLDPLKEMSQVIPSDEMVEVEGEDLIEGIIEGLEDFAEGHVTVFESDDELEAYLMSL